MCIQYSFLQTLIYNPDYYVTNHISQLYPTTSRVMFLPADTAPATAATNTTASQTLILILPTLHTRTNSLPVG